ncbi:MAG: tRNA (adenosine(37)-N6)-threonylcarbamoyltransferase complex dimerization subunit type 1 TsaB [Chloroflexota bacterium]
MELAIDTTTEWASIALSHQGEVQAELTWCVGRNHSVELMPAIISLLHQAKTDVASLTGIVVARGPGSFNGIRVGMAVAKGLAFALSVPLIGLSSLESLAFPHRWQGLPVCALRPAGLDLAVALFRWRRGRQEELWPGQLMSTEDLLAKVKARTLFCGEVGAPLKDRLKEALGAKAVFAPWSAPKSGYLIEMAWPQLERGEGDDPFTLQPLYLRPPHITIRKERGRG